MRSLFDGALQGDPRAISIERKRISEDAARIGKGRNSITMPTMTIPARRGRSVPGEVPPPIAIATTIYPWKNYGTATDAAINSYEWEPLFEYRGATASTEKHIDKTRWRGENLHDIPRTLVTPPQLSFLFSETVANPFTAANIPRTLGDIYKSAKIAYNATNDGFEIALDFLEIRANKTIENVLGFLGRAERIVALLSGPNVENEADAFATIVARQGPTQQGLGAMEEIQKLEWRPKPGSPTAFVSYRRAIETIKKTKTEFESLYNPKKLSSVPGAWRRHVGEMSRQKKEEIRASVTNAMMRWIGRTQNDGISPDTFDTIFVVADDIEQLTREHSELGDIAIDVVTSSERHENLHPTHIKFSGIAMAATQRDSVRSSAFDMAVCGEVKCKNYWGISCVGKHVGFALVQDTVRKDKMVPWMADDQPSDSAITRQTKIFPIGIVPNTITPATETRRMNEEVVVGDGRAAYFERSSGYVAVYLEKSWRDVVVAAKKGRW
jgi:hypothetical protein